MCGGVTFLIPRASRWRGQQIPAWRFAPRRNDKGLGVGWVPPCFASAGRARRPSPHGPLSYGPSTSFIGRWSTARLSIVRLSVRGAGTKLECGLEILGVGWCLIDGDGDFDGYFCAGGIGVDFHGALKLADAFAHAADTEAGPS
jgi:hypothetical protein